ncbi:hypothetical protein [Hyalangium sp.]|uniref:hypothetical protein n=1 Tax=Hyalangium sp. TaxID=2028555 RepID=UPI002D6174F7|nr:hypothetical protein [Hyalangium sp.]HYH98257.1 hypothetical protein [Hyalangium sp.]
MAIRVSNESPSAAQAAAEAARRAAEEAARRAAEEAARRAAEEAARLAAEAASSAQGSDAFTSTSTPQGPSLSGETVPAEGSSLLIENTGDGSVNCLDGVGDVLAQAAPDELARSEVLFLTDTRPGAEGETGHVVIHQGDHIYDPATQQWSESADYLRDHPEYQVAGTVPGEVVHSILSAEPGLARQAALEQANLPPHLAQMVVADVGGGLPEPRWLEQGSRPPWFNAAEWNHLVPEDKAAILDEIRADWASHVEAMEPPWMREGTAPPPLSEDWDQLSPEQQQERALSQWEATVQEELAFYFGEIPEGGLPAEEPLLLSTNGAPWGQGMSGEWATYHQEGQDPIAQYLNTGLILGGEGDDYTHGNLCGELSVMSVVGLGIAEGLQNFNALGLTTQDGTAILSDGEALTNSTHLEEFFRQNGWQVVGEDGDGNAPAMKDLNGGHSAANTYNNNHAREPTSEEVQRLLADGGALTVLVNIDGAQDGMLASAGDSADDITHWVSVLAVSENAQGETYVRVYNPYQNREEVYSWEEFQNAWNTPSPSEQGYTYVAARPPETSTDAP